MSFKPSDSPAGRSIDTEGLSRSLPALLNAYAAVIEQVSSGPVTRLHRRPSAAPGSPKPGLLDRFGDFGLAPLGWLRDWWWGFSIRPVVRLFVETHVSARASEMARFLRPKRLMMGQESADDRQRLDECLRSLAYAEGMVAGGSRSLGPVRYVPPVVFALSWILIALNPGFRQLQTAALYLVLYSFPFLIMLVYAVVIRFGFRWKRAFFAGWPLGAVRGVDRTRPSEANRSASIYELETRVYAGLGLPKHREFPIDVVLHPALYWFLTILAGFVIPLVRGDLGTARWLTVALFQFLLMLLFLVPTVGAVRKYRERKKAGLV
ncbi:MAG: hypothetical protein FJ020_06070 [Chloroflexi bacterium]|nr:hypothetical protein [Chloroflexota bacterium]